MSQKFKYVQSKYDPALIKTQQLVNENVHRLGQSRSWHSRDSISTLAFLRHTNHLIRISAAKTFLVAQKILKILRCNYHFKIIKIINRNFITILRIISNEIKIISLPVFRSHWFRKWDIIEFYNSSILLAIDSMLLWVQRLSALTFMITC